MYALFSCIETSTWLPSTVNAPDSGSRLLAMRLPPCNNGIPIDDASVRRSAECGSIMSRAGP